MSDFPLPPEWGDARRSDPDLAADMLELVKIFSVLKPEQRQELMDVVRSLLKAQPH